jgi:ADP-ribose pyrophosphatase YjhB (NUDIX family)
MWEDPAECARRETAEETGLRVRNLGFLAITNDVMLDRGRHYVTLWFSAEAEEGEAHVLDEREIANVGWFDVEALPDPLQPFLVNLLEGRCLPPLPAGAALRPPQPRGLPTGSEQSR